MTSLVVVTERWSLDALALLSRCHSLEVLECPVGELTPDQKANVQALLIRSRTKIDKDLLEKLPNLKAIGTATSGFDHIDLYATQSRYVRVFFAADANAQSAAELTWLLLMSCARKFNLAQSKLRQGDWNRQFLVGTELFRRDFGIIGLGRVGSRVAQIAKAFEMKIFAFDPYVDDQVFKSLGAQRVGLEEVMKLSEFVTVHVPLTKETHHMLNRKTMEALHPDAILINTSRGSVINEFDLCVMLRDGDLCAAGLDVFEREPLDPQSPLLKSDRVVLSPHIGASTETALRSSSMNVTTKVISSLIDPSLDGDLPQRPSRSRFSDLEPV